MSRVDGIAALVLAAGLSQRFEGGDKLEEIFDGHPLALHVGKVLSALPLARRLAVCNAAEGIIPDGFRRLGFEIVINPNPAAGQGNSLALGAAAAVRSPLQALLVCLSDMPFVTGDHILRLVTAWRTDPARIAATSAGRYLGPPVLFPASSLAALCQMTGDRGARPLLEDAIRVEIPPNEARDFDTRADFERQSSR